MRSVLLFGGTRGVGRHVLDRALEAGHQVTAVARDATKIEVEHPRLRVVEGDATDPGLVDSVMPGHDAVVSAIGAPPSSRDRVRERATRTQIAAMKAHGVRRLISLSSHGVGESASDLPFLMKWVIVPLVLRRVWEDHAVQEDLVRDSGLDWTLVKPTHLHDGAATGDYAHGFVSVPRGRSMKIARRDVAAFMVDQVEQSTYVGREPGVTG